MAGIQYVQEKFKPWGNLTNDPTFMPFHFIGMGNLYAKNGSGTNEHDNSSNFWTNTANYGAQINQTDAPSPWDELVSLSNSKGVLSNIITSALDTSPSSAVVGIRITVDGKVYEFQDTIPTVQYRFVFGHMIEGLPVVATVGTSDIDEYPYLPGGYLDTGFSRSYAGDETNNVTTDDHFILPPHTMMAYGMPLLCWNQSLKVELYIGDAETSTPGVTNRALVNYWTSPLQ